MEGHRDESDRIYGPPRITLVPQQDPDADRLPTFHTTRTTQKTTNVQLLKQPETWYPASTSDSGEAALSWDLQRQHKRWLRGNRPEAAVAGLSDLLADLMTDLDGPETERLTTRPLLALGHMPDFTDPKRVPSKPLLATAAGSSGEVVRLTALTQYRWQWGSHADPTLHLLQADFDDKQEIAQWSIDDSPITQIKTAQELARHDPSRFIIVQKKLSTTVLSPRYQRVPISVQSYRGASDQDTTSRIDPRPILTIQSRQTGGNAHSDVAFKPSTDGQWEQLALIDDRGYWTIWDIGGRDMVGRHGRHPALKHCGHIQLGMLETLPQHPDIFISPKHHGILWIGPPVADPNHWDGPLRTGATGSTNSAHLSHSSESYRKVVVWNSAHLVVVNPSDQSLQDFAPELLKRQHDEILAVEINPANQAQAFVLTTSSLIWVDFRVDESSSKKSSGIHVLLSCAHLRAQDSSGQLKLTVFNGWEELGSDSSVACLYSEDDPNLTIFTFGVAEDTNLPQFQHHTIAIQSQKAPGQAPPPGIHTVCLAPAPFSSMLPDGPGASYMRHGVQFWQLFILRRDLSVACTVGAASLTGTTNIHPPDVCQRFSRRGWKSEYHKRRLNMIRGLADTFVVPDAFGDLEELARLRTGKEGGEDMTDALVEPMPKRWPRAPVEGIDLLISRVAISIESVAMESQHIRASGEATSIFDSVRSTALDCLDRPGDSMALKTFRDFGATFEVPPVDGQSEQAWDDQLQSLLSMSDARLAVEAVTPKFLGLEVLSGPSFEDMRRRLEQSWPSDNVPPVARLSRELALAEAAEATLRSLYGIVAFDAETSETFEGLTTWVPEPKTSTLEENAGTQHQPYPSPRLTESVSPGPPSSRSTSRAPSVSLSRSSSQDFSVPSAVQRLSMLAASFNVAKRPAGQEHAVLAYWPEERGVSTQGYVSSIQTTSSKRVEEARRGQRQKAESQRCAKRNRIMRPGAGSEAASAPTADFPLSSQFAPMPASSQTLPPIIAGGPPRVARKGAGVGKNNVTSFSTQAQPTNMSSQLPRLIGEPAGIMTSQAPSSSQTQALPQIMSQPVAGQHGKRILPQQQKKKKPKRKGGF